MTPEEAANLTRPEFIRRVFEKVDEYRGTSATPEEVARLRVRMEGADVSVAPDVLRACKIVRAEMHEALGNEKVANIYRNRVAEFDRKEREREVRGRQKLVVILFAVIGLPLLLFLYFYGLGALAAFLHGWSAAS